MNVRTLDKVLLPLALLCVALGIIERLIDDTWVWTPQGWWRGAMFLLAVNVVLLLGAIRNAVERRP